MNYKFILIDPLTGRDAAAWVLAMPAVLGRSPDAEISIGDPSISRRHCQFSLDVEGALVVRDLESMNGTYVEEDRVKKAVLRPGIVIQVGAISLRIEWTNDPITRQPITIDSQAHANVTQPIERKHFG